MSQKLPNLLIIALVGAAVIVLISLGLESVINNLDDMLVPCQHGTSYNKATASCNCMNTPFKGKYCGECDCAHGQCMVGGTTPKAGSLYGCRCPIATKRFGHKCQLCYAENTTSCKGVCQNGFYGALCDKTCKANIVQSDLFASTLSADAAVCRNIRDNGGTCNYCSGHGLCGATGNCECEKNYFNGPNGGCSQTCAIADNGKICSGHGVCEKIAGVPTCACEYGWRGTDCSVPCPGMEVNGVPCSGHGQCLVNYTGTPTTSCNCNQKFRGDACEIECPGEIVACSGHGTCDDAGVCACNSPAGGVTWVGEACSCSDFITCSGNGNCMGNAQCLCIGNWDGEHCRQCKENYYGSNCQFYCDSDGSPSAEGKGCYGRGTCTILDFGKREERVMCECFGDVKVFDDGKITTHTSNYEPLDNCLDCAAGYVPKITAVDAYGLPDGVKVPCELYCSSQTCNNLGDCNEDWGIPGETLCKCHHGPDDRKHLDDNNFCLSCETDWFPEDIRSEHGCSNFCTGDIANAPYNGYFPTICDTGVVDCVQCSGHGTCGPRGACLCEDGYTGVECNIQCTGANGLTCSGHGECKVNQLQELMQFEYEFVGNSGALYSCECNPQDPYTDEERKDFRLRVANGEVNGTLEDPPIKTFYGEMCEYNCKSPPWALSEVCNGFGDCEINKIQDPNGGYATCTSDNNCKTNNAVQAIISGSADWSAEKGPFCHKADSPPGCVTSNFTNDDCFYILSLQRPTAARGKECMRDATCRDFLDGNDWHQWCNVIQTAQNPFTTCSSDWSTYCALIHDGQSIPSKCANYVNQLLIDDFTVNHQLNYCYEKDKSRFPFKITEHYRGDTAVELHDTIAEQFEQFTIKYPNLDMDATQFCDNYMKMFDVEVSHIRTDQLYICNNRIQHTDNCSTEALALDTVWKPFYVDCDGQQTQYTTLEEAIDNRHEGCTVVEEVVDVDNVTLSNLFAVKSQMGEHCVDNNDCASNECYEGTCCAAGTNTTNIEKCQADGIKCLPGSNRWKGAVVVTSGAADLSLKLSEVECEQYALSIGATLVTGSWSTGFASGCIKYTNRVEYNRAVNNEPCGVGSWDCVQAEACTYDGSSCTYVEVTNGEPDLSMSEDECLAYGIENGHGLLGGNVAHAYTVPAPAGCWVHGNNIRYNTDTTHSTGVSCGSILSGIAMRCIQKLASYWLDNVGCVNAAVGETCIKDAGCQSEVCIGGKCALQESPNCAQVNAAGKCSQCIADATFSTSVYQNGYCSHEWKYLSGHTDVAPGYTIVEGINACVNEFGAGYTATSRNTDGGILCSLLDCSNPGGIIDPHLTLNPLDYITHELSGCTPNGYCAVEVTSGAPDLSVSQSQCETYGESIGQWGGVVSITGEIKGCYYITDPNISPKVWYNTDSSSVAECNLGGRACIQKDKNKIKMFVTDEGCVDRPSDALEHEVHTLLEKTCSNAEGVFPVCQYPTDACNINGVSACNDGDSCHTFEGDAICSTTGVLNATCKFDIVSEPMSFSTYKCPLPLVLTNNTCLEAARDFNWFTYCKNSNAVLFHDNFGVDAIQENEQPAVIHLEEHQRNGDLFSFWVKTNSMIRSSASISVKSGSHEIFRVFLHQGQIQLNAVDTLQSCPVDQPTCNDDFMYNINEWLNLKVSIHYSLTSSSVTLHYNGNTKTDGFLCTGCGSVNSISAIYIEPGAADTYYDEIIFSKAIAAPSVQSTCSNFKYCDFDVDYRDKCVDLVTNVRYPHTVEPQHDIIEVCEHRKEQKKFVGITTNIEVLQGMDALNWTGYCKFQEELDENIPCGTLTYETLEDYETTCSQWISPIDTSRACVVENLQHDWNQQCDEIDDAFVTSDMKIYCDPACYEHFINYDQCDVRDTIFSGNSEIPLAVSGCNNVNWLNWCNDVAQNKHPGICSAVECDCSRQQGMTGDSCDLFCNIAQDGSPCGIDSGAGICRYTKEQQDQLAQGPFPNELIELIGECECFASEGTSNCDQECAACVNTTYSYETTSETLSFAAQNSDHFIYDSNFDPEITVCSNTPITFERTDSGHPLRVVSSTDCHECYSGEWFSLPTSSLSGWTDATHNSPSTVTFTEEGTYYYLCTSHNMMVGKINVRTCGGQIGICDASRGLCQCLPPWTIEKHVEYETWKGDIRRRLERVYELPTSLLNVPPNYIVVASGAPDGSVSEAECQAYGESIGQWGNVVSITGEIKGCYYITDPNISPKVWYNTDSTSVAQCNLGGRACIQIDNGAEYTEVASGAPDGSVSEAECQAYGESIGMWNHAESHSTWTIYPSGCWRHGSNQNIYYNRRTTTAACHSGEKCIQKGDNEAYDKAQEDIFRIRLMQGREAFTRYYLDTSTTEDNWKTVYDAWKADPSQYQCAGKPCDFHDTVLLGNLHESSWNYNYDCSKECPEVDPATKIPCSGHGRCAITGSCVCDPAKVIRGTDAATGSTFQINIFGGEKIEDSEFMVSKLDQTGYRGENCNLTCPGYHPERQDMTEVCSGHGVCNLEAECQCDIGYTGEICQFTCPGFNEGDLNICAGHGTCGMSQVQIYRDIFAEFNETFYINGTEAVRKTNEQRACPLPASKSVGLGYSVINDIGFLDLTKIYMLRETTLCASASINQCKRWKDYQNLYYVNRHPFTIDDYTKPTGCILDGNTIMFNDRTTEVTCENGCLCEGIEEVPGVISIHDYTGKEGGFYEINTGDPDLSVNEQECRRYAEVHSYTFNVASIAWGSQGALDARGCLLTSGSITWNDHATSTATCDAYASVKCLQKSNFAYQPLTEWDGYIFQDSGMPGENSEVIMTEYECYFYADKVLLQPYMEVQSGSPSMEVTREECQRYVAENYGSSMYEDADDSAVAKGCVTIMNGNVVQKVVYNTNENTVACSSTNRCVEKPYERISSSAKPSGCLKIGDDIKFNYAASSVGCTSSTICIEKEIKQVDPVVIYHKQIGFNYSENVGRYAEESWTGKYLFEQVSSGPPDLSVSEAECKEYGESIGQWGGALRSTFEVTQAECASTALVNSIKAQFATKFPQDTYGTLGNNVYSTDKLPHGCMMHNDRGSPTYSRVLWNPDTTDVDNPINSGYSTNSMALRICKYANGDFVLLTDPTAKCKTIHEIKGCYYITDPNISPKVWYNTDTSSVAECNLGGRACIQRGGKEYVSTIIAGPANESVIIDICDNDPDCGGYFAIIPDTPGTYMAVSKLNNALVEDRTEAYRLVGLETECTGELNKVIHEKITGRPDMNKGSITLAECRLIAERAGKEFATDYYSGDPTACFLFTDGKIYFNQQSTTVECSASKICYETITRRKREIGAEFYEVDFGLPDGSASQADCERYGTSVGITAVSIDYSTFTNSNVPAGCWKHGNNIRYNTDTTTSAQCGIMLTGQPVKCIQKRDVFFTPYTPANKDVDLNSCAEVCRITDQCAFYAVESNKCFMIDGCTELATGTDEIYQLQSPEDGRVFTHMMKLPPTLCMSENGARFDDKTQAPVIRTINILTANCTGDQIWSAFAGKCVDFSYNPRFDATFFLDKGTPQEKQLPVQCQVTGNNTARCALCTCFADFIYGQWAGFTCDTCNVGFGNSQCRQICPGFDGDNMASMCGGNGACLFGSEVNAENGERLFQQANCVCGQDNQYAERQPEAEIYSTYPTTGGIAGDGSIVGYYYFTPVPYTINYQSRFDAQNACNRFNDLDNIDRGGFCFGVYRKYISVEAVSPEVYLAMGFVGGSYTLYGKYWEKEAISGFSRFYNFKRLELYNALEGLPVAKDCKDILSIRSDGYDTCNHFATPDIDPSCTTCEEGWTGKNCRTVCSKCLLGGGCAGVPSQSTSSACVCPAGAGALWEHQCCPTGFMVADKTTWQGKSQSDVNAIRLSLTYDSSTTNELDASYYCKTCPGISHEDWMSPDALYKVCSGPTRGTCQLVPGKLELACDCKMNSITKNRWLGRACACDESINIPYSTDAMTAESTDYGCLLPTNGNGMCPTGSTVNLFFNPPKVYGQDANYIVGESYGSPFLGVFAGQTFAIKKVICSQSSPCHTGEGHCENDEECAGTLKCFIRNDGEEKLSFNAEKITYDMNYCYHEDETMVGCHPTDFENYLATREYHKQFYYDAANAEFKAPALGEYVPYSQDANLALVIHQQAFTCPKGRYGITVPDRVSYRLEANGYYCSSFAVGIYSGNGDNPGSNEDQTKRCFEGCLNQRTPFSGTWTFIAKSFHVQNGNGRCWCSTGDVATCSRTPNSVYRLYDIITEGEWNVCEKCQPGKFQDTKGNVGWVKVRSGPASASVTKEECRTYAYWHGLTWGGDTYSHNAEPYGCVGWSNTHVYFNNNQNSPGDCAYSSTNVNWCLVYGGGLGIAKNSDNGLGKHPNCKNCPVGKFGGPIGSWAADLCEVCQPGTKQNAAGTGCEDCPAGKYELGGVCLQCPNGQFSPQKHPGTVEQPCLNCPAGKDTNGQIETAGTSDAVCRFCPAGKANGVAGTDCVDCGVGKFTSSTGKTSCDMCGIQKFANLPGMTACKTCGVDSPYAGLYGHTNNRDTCVQCNLGEFVSTTTGVCTDCPKGYEQPLNNYQTGCKICDAGEYSPNPGTSTCTKCELGKYQGQTGKDKCEQCGPGTYGNVRELSVCKDCAVGRRAPNNEMHNCEACPKGQFQGQTKQSSCIACPVHKYTDQTGQSACKNCAAGKYGDVNKAQTSSSHCVNCAAGKYSTGGGTACVNCPGGQYQASSGQSSCNYCPTGHYTTSAGSSSCTAGCSNVLPAGCLGNTCACYRARGDSYGGCTGFYDNSLTFQESYSCPVDHLWDCSKCGTTYGWQTQVIEFAPCSNCGAKSCRTAACGSGYQYWGVCGHDYCYRDGVWCWMYATNNGCPYARGSAMYLIANAVCAHTDCGCATPCDFYGKTGCNSCQEDKQCTRTRHWFWADC